MKPKVIPLLEQCISSGIERGWNRAHKHDDEPSPGVIKDCIDEAIWSDLHEFFDFPEHDTDGGGAA
jgi:hypothetical protein